MKFRPTVQDFLHHVTKVKTQANHFLSPIFTNAENVWQFCFSSMPYFSGQRRAKSIATLFQRKKMALPAAWLSCAVASVWTTFRIVDKRLRRESRPFSPPETILPQGCSNDVDIGQILWDQGLPQSSCLWRQRYGISPLARPRGCFI